MIRKYLHAMCVGMLFALSPLASAFQTLLAEAPVTIEPRMRPQPPAGLQAVLRVDSSLVLIAAHVTTLTGESVMSLSRDNFQLTEDNVEQTITHFTKDDAPVSVGVLFDMSGSMVKKMQTASEAVATFFKTANPEDEFFLVEFGDRAKLAVPFTPDSDELYRHIAHLKPWGKTSLLDAVYLALAQMKHARNFRKAIVILSDGGDNWSRHSVREVRNALLESDVQMYAMGIFDPDDSGKLTAEERNGPRLLDDLAKQSGGRHYRVGNLGDLPAISAAIGNELRNEYLLGYYPRNTSRDGKYRQVKMKLAFPDPRPELRTYYRRGYYAPTE
jgi:Ca-activated chloride channel homolog